MALHLRYHGETHLPVEIEGLTPDWARDKTLAEIERCEILHGNRHVPLAELFAVSGTSGDSRIELSGELRGVHWIGAKMASGEIRIAGSAGRHLGSGMQGGAIVVEGSAGDWVGAEMRGGNIEIHGDAGDQVGGAYRGSAKGMTGGMILVRGNAGHEVGHTMRRGTIAIGGSAGDLVGMNMIAGTILVFGPCGIRAGAGMRRGTIGLFGPRPAPLLPTFRYGATFQPEFLRLVLQSLRAHGLPLDDALWSTPMEIYHGDLVELGRGEILIRPAL